MTTSTSVGYYIDTASDFRCIVSRVFRPPSPGIPVFFNTSKYLLLSESFDEASVYRMPKSYRLFFVLFNCIGIVSNSISFRYPTLSSVCSEGVAFSCPVLSCVDAARNRFFALSCCFYFALVDQASHCCISHFVVLIAVGKLTQMSHHLCRYEGHLLR